jgi:hypothetical protein
MRIAPASPGRSPAPPAPRPPAAAKKFATVLDEGSLVAPSRPATVGTVATAATGSKAPSPAAAVTKQAPATTPLRAMLERTVGAEKQVDALLEAAARGKTFSPAQLLAMQATVARYSQTVEVVSRVADRLVGAVKQTMGTQV